MKVMNYETMYEAMEVCTMVSEKNYEAAPEEASRKIAQLEREKIHIERKSEARRSSDIFLSLCIGIILGGIIFTLAAYTYKLGWWSVC